MKNLLLIALLLISCTLFAQFNNIITDTTAIIPNTTQNNNNKVTISAYAQIDYNQPIEGTKYNKGLLDVHRMVTTMAYRFNSRVRFLSEIEFEHAVEVFIEQAFLSYRFNKHFNLKAGLILIPMGIINEYHEPPSYNGVERPSVDKNIVPTTWREIGFGFTGRLDDASLKYQIYLVNGFNGYDGEGKFRGKDGLRKGRQKGAKSFSTAPNLSAKIDYYGLSGLKLGLAGYFGKSQSNLFDGLDKSNRAVNVEADSSVINIAMVGLDARFNQGGLQMRGQYILANLANTQQYNSFTGKDLGSRMQGFYLELGYNLLYSLQKKEKLIPFVRFEKYNTHQKTAGNLTPNDSYNMSEIFFGLAWKVDAGAVFKGDLQLIKSAADTQSKKQLNFGVGIWF